MSLLQTTQLTKYFGETHAVDHVDFTVTEGEVLALIGSNGAGKTTLINLISGLIPVDSGSIVFQGADVTGDTIHEKIAKGIARSFQLVNLFDQLTLLDNVALSIFSREDLTRKLLALADHHRAVWEEAFEILRQFGLAISATHLQGIYNDDPDHPEFHDIYGPLRNQKPIDVLGGSIYLYRWPP